MSDFKYGSLQHHLSRNLGDEIQTLASDQFLPRVDDRFERDRLGQVASDQQWMIILNGWFSHAPEKTIPASDSFKPVITGFHIAESASEALLRPEAIAYFKRHEPIGCRDEGTMHLLQEHGINAYFSKCLTLTFPQRDSQPEDGRVFIVDADHLPIPGRLKEDAVVLSHIDTVRGDGFTNATNLLQRYRDEARLVITTRLHCALPCVAMGIPVVFFSDRHEYRVKVAETIGLKIYRKKTIGPPRPVAKMMRAMGLGKTLTMIQRQLLKSYHKHVEKVDWEPAVLDISKEKEAMSRDVNKRIAEIRRQFTTRPRR